MSLIKKLALFILIFFILTQFTLPYIIPSRVVYNQRINYDAFKDNEFVINITIQEIKKTIRKEQLKDYIILLGDSVGYGTPCPPESTITSYMNAIAKREGKAVRVFNLAAPSMMAGDIYIVIKLLNDNGISTQNLIIDLPYWEFYAKNPVFWLKNNFKKVDPKDYKKVADSGKMKAYDTWGSIKTEIKRFLYTDVSIVKYSQFINLAFKRKGNSVLRENKAVVAPWYTKKDLPAIMKKPENLWYYASSPFVMDDSNFQVYFFKKIMELQKGKNTLFFLTAMNDKLLGSATSVPGYVDNMKKIDGFFTNKGVKYINYNKKIGYNLFSDHVHLIQDGYRFLAEDLWKRINS